MENENRNIEEKCDICEEVWDTSFFCDKHFGKCLNCCKCAVVVDPLTQKPHFPFLLENQNEKQT